MRQAPPQGRRSTSGKAQWDALNIPSELTLLTGLMRPALKQANLASQSPGGNASGLCLVPPRLAAPDLPGGVVRHQLPQRVADGREGHGLALVLQRSAYLPVARRAVLPTSEPPTLKPRSCGAAVGPQ